MNHNKKEIENIAEGNVAWAACWMAHNGLASKEWAKKLGANFDD